MLDHEAAFRTDWDDHRIFHRLRLHQAEDLGAEILFSIGPADAAAGDLAGAHVHGLDPRTVDIDLKKRPRPRQQIDFAAGELDGQIGLCFARRRFLEIVRAHGPENESQKRAQDAVLVQAADRVERMIDRLDLGYG